MRSSLSEYPKNCLDRLVVPCFAALVLRCSSPSLVCFVVLLLILIIGIANFMQNYIRVVIFTPGVPLPDISRMSCPKGYVLRRFGLKTGIDFTHSGLEADKIFSSK